MVSLLAFNISVILSVLKETVQEYVCWNLMLYYLSTDSSPPVSKQETWDGESLVAGLLLTFSGHFLIFHLPLHPQHWEWAFRLWLNPFYLHSCYTHLFFPSALSPLSPRYISRHSPGNRMSSLLLADTCRLYEGSQWDLHAKHWGNKPVESSIPNK